MKTLARTSASAIDYGLGPAGSILLIAATLSLLFGVRPVAADEALWPSGVRHVDPAAQKYQRLPGIQQAVTVNAAPGAFRLVGFFRVEDSVSFVYRTKRYRLAGVAPIPNGQVCPEPDGSRRACGLEARTRLRELLASRATVCTPFGETGEPATVTCDHAGNDIAAALVGEAYAIPTSR